MDVTDKLRPFAPFIFDFDFKDVNFTWLRQYSTDPEAMLKFERNDEVALLEIYPVRRHGWSARIKFAHGEL